MDAQLNDLIDSLESLKVTIKKAVFTEHSFDQQHGWNQIHLDHDDIIYYISNFINKLNSYGDAEITEDLDATISNHIQNIGRLNASAKTYFTNNASHLIQFIPSMLLTLLTIISDVEYELFSYQNIQEKRLLPRGLATRLRGISARLDSVSDSSENLKEKITVINEAHEAAESLPTDLASLKEAKKELEILISSAKKEFTNVKKDIFLLRDEAHSLKEQAKKASDEIDDLKLKSQKALDEATSLVEQCDDALQITTTQGLAAGFDQKASELKNSIWVWIVGLLLALVSGAWIGAERVAAFTLVLNEQLTAGQAILHTIMSVFSIGGPLWLAWISTQQINQRFKLSEDYSYKATVAKSFTGFKKFAERFDPSTEERLFNSTLDRLDEMPLRLIEGKDYNSPWHEFTDSDAFKTAISMFPTLAKEAGKFANKTALKKKVKHQNPYVHTDVKTKAAENQTENELL